MSNSQFYPFDLLAYRNLFTVLPYVNRLNIKIDKADREKLQQEAEKAKSESKKMSKQEHSRESRKALQQYLVELIRAVVSAGGQATRRIIMLTIISIELADVQTRIQSIVSIF